MTRALYLSLISASLLACSGVVELGSIPADFERARADALSLAGSPADGWQADAAISLSHEIIADLVREALDEQRPPQWSTDTPLGSLSLRPTLHPQQLQARPGGCDRCLDLVLEAAGEVAWTLGPISGSTPYTTAGTARLQLQVEESGRQQRLRAELDRLSGLSMSVGAARGIELGPALEEWLSSALGEALAEAELVQVDGEELPVRALRPVVDSEGLRLELLSAAAASTPLERMPEPEPGSWAGAISTGSLVSLAAAQGFREGGQPTVEARELSLEGERFDLLVKLWYTDLPPWWREYRIRGDVRLRDGELQLEPTEATAEEGSATAAVVDAVELVTGSSVLEEIEQALRTTVPLPSSAAGSVELGIARLVGQDGAILLYGDAGMRPDKPRARSARPDRGERERPRRRAGGRGKADSTRRPR